MCCRVLKLTLGFEVNGEGMSVHNDVCGSATLWKLYGASNNLVQELRLDDAWFHTTPCAPKLVRSGLSSPFSCCFCCYGNDSPLACHWSAVKKALDVGRFFQKS